MRRVLCMLIVLLLAPVASVHAQVEAPSWELGWESDVEDGVILNLDGNRWSISHTLEIWIANNRPFDLEVDVELELPSDAPVEAEVESPVTVGANGNVTCLLYTSPSPRDYAASRMPSSA